MILAGLAECALRKGATESDLLCEFLKRIFNDGEEKFRGGKCCFTVWTKFDVIIEKDSEDTVFYGLLRLLVSSRENSDYIWLGNKNLRLKVVIRLHNLIFLAGFDPKTLRAVLHWLLVYSLSCPPIWNGSSSRNANGDSGEVLNESKLKFMDSPLQLGEWKGEDVVEISAARSSLEETAETIKMLQVFLKDQLKNNLQAFKECCSFILEKPFIGLPAVVLEAFVAAMQNSNSNLLVQRSLDELFQHFLLHFSRNEVSDYPITREDQESTLVALAEIAFSKAQARHNDNDYEWMLRVWLSLVESCLGVIQNGIVDSDEPGDTEADVNGEPLDSRSSILKYLRELLRSQLEILDFL
jgi:hypothetical protein